jgi:hypothetical protein
MWRRVDLEWTDVSEERIYCIFRVEKSASEEPAWVDMFLQNVGSHKIYTAPHLRWRRENLKSYIHIFVTKRKSVIYLRTYLNGKAESWESTENKNIYRYSSVSSL